MDKFENVMLNIGNKNYETVLKIIDGQIILENDLDFFPICLRENNISDCNEEIL